jgi:two-component system, OmpR family, alkaline phosphatase synthesis response regulator PhoP
MLKVLLIDDEQPIRLLCRVNLEAAGMQVVEAPDGPSGIEAARSERPDVILLDVMMPGYDGWQVAEELLDDSRTSSTPIVFLTARAEFQDRAADIEAGGLDYVTKPFNPIDLAPLVERVARRPRSAVEGILRRERISRLRALSAVGLRR